jgi:hypothetical protein
MMLILAGNLQSGSQHTFLVRQLCQVISSICVMSESAIVSLGAKLGVTASKVLRCVFGESFGFNNTLKSV